MTSPRFKDASRTQLQRAQKLHRREQRTRYRQMLVEGPQAIRELLRFHPELVRDLYVTSEAWDRHEDVPEAAGDSRVWTHVIDIEDMRDLSADGQGMVAVADTPENPEPARVLKGARLVLATLAISDPGNLGTIIRTADAAGADAVIVGRGSAEIYSPKVIRSAAGSHFHIPVLPANTLSQGEREAGTRVQEITDAAHSFGLQVCLADGYGQWDLRALVEAAYEARHLGIVVDGPDLNRPVVWIMGNEAHGFAGEDLRGADARVAIPLYGKAESLNVAMAASVCAYTTAMIQK